MVDDDLLRSTSPMLIAFGVLGVAESWEVELLCMCMCMRDIISYIMMM